MGHLSVGLGLDVGRLSSKNGGCTGTGRGGGAEEKERLLCHVYVHLNNSSATAVPTRRGRGENAAKPESSSKVPATLVPPSF